MALEGAHPDGACLRIFGMTSISILLLAAGLAAQPAIVDADVAAATAAIEAGAYRQAEAVLQRAQRSLESFEDDLSQAELLNAWSAIHLKIGQTAVSEADLRRALPLVIKVKPWSDLAATVLHNLAAIEMRTGRYSDALCDEQEALLRFQRLLPPDHPTLIRVWASLASVQYMAGRRQEARKSMDRALASAERTYGPVHPFLADLLDSDALVLNGLKLKKDARLARERAKKIRGAPSGEDRLVYSVQEPAQQGVYLRSR